MQDNVKAIEQQVKGHAKIEIMNHDGEVIKTIEQDNAICPGTMRRGRDMYKAMFSYYNPFNPGFYDDDQRASMRYLRLSNVDYSHANGEAMANGTEPIFPYTAEQENPATIGYIDRENQLMSSSDSLGLVNMNDSYVIPDRAVWVYEWQASKAVGVFNTITHGTSTYTNPTTDTTELVLVNGKPFSISSSNFSVYDGYIYQAKEYTSISKRSIATGVLEEIFFGDGITCPIDPNRIYVTKKDNKMYYILMDGNSSYIITDDNANGGVWSISGNLSRDHGFSADNDYIYRSYSDRIYRYNYDGTSVDSTQHPLGSWAAMFKGAIYKYNDNKRVKASDVTWGGDSVQNPSSNHKYGKAYNNYNDIHGDDWYMAVQWSWERSGSSGSNGYYLTKRKLQPNGELAFHEHQGAILKLDTPVTKSASESMRITYTFNFS